jgi:hypothetical protein
MDQIALAMTDFQILAQRLIASRAEGDGQLRIEGVASSTIRDHHGDEITEKALRKMASTAVGMTIFLNHEYKVPTDVFGVVEKARVVKSDDIDKRTGNPVYDLRVGIRVAKSNPFAVDTFNQIENDGVKLGISIGAMVPEGGATFAKAGGGRYIVDDADLVEASIISLPANSRSWVDHAVKALAGDFPMVRGKESKIVLQKRMELLEQLAGEETLVEAQLGDVVLISSDNSNGTIIAKAGTPEAEELIKEMEAPAELEVEEAEPEAEPHEDDPIEDLEKTRVSVWKDDEVIEIDTGRKKPKADEDPTPQVADAPENEGGLEGVGGVVKAGDELVNLTGEAPDPMVKALMGQLQASRAENVELRRERDAALEVAQKAVEGARTIVARLGELPVGRKTTDGRYADPELRKAEDAIDSLTGIYDADVIKMLKK